MKLLAFAKNLLQKGGINAIPFGKSIATVITAIKEGKFDPKRALWLIAELIGVFTLLWLTLFLSKEYNVSADDILHLAKEIGTLGLGS